ncbi:MAG: glycosyltransferase family 2 protein [Chitinophagales bacterium]|nr:glycosyltransferase family 2 protein [Bacteroidota bacterium]
MQIFFWVLLSLVVYTYLGYFVLLYVLKSIAAWQKEPVNFAFEDLPTCTIVIAAYNEAAYLDQKIENTLALLYPQGKLQCLVVTDGSTDETVKIYQKFPTIKHFHENKRAGKLAAVERVLPFVDTEVVVFTDANTLLNKDAAVNICRHFALHEVGAVAGEKRIFNQISEDAVAAGEGIYWKYESLLKKWDADFYSVVGAAGELFAIRRNLYQHVEPDTIIEDFVLTTRIAMQGFRVLYEPQAYAIEAASASVYDEMKRKVRIAAGAWQAVGRFAELLNIFRYGRLSFIYISHRFLRWTIAPFALPVLFILNAILVYYQPTLVYEMLFFFQLLFYTLSFLGYLFASNNLKIKTLFIPFYFCMMNYCMWAGLSRFLQGKQQAVWEKAQRRDEK